MKKYSLEKYVGVRYTKHKTRKYKGRVDQCFFIRYRLDGKVKEECAGWSHQGVNAAIASEIRAELKSNQRTGEGERTLADKRLKVKEKEEKIRAELEKQNADSVSFNKIFFKSYFPHAQLNKKDSSFNREKSLFVKWIDPVIGKMPLKDIAVFHIEKIKKNMNDSGQSPRSIQYGFAVIRQVYNWSYKEKLFDGDNPVLEVKLSKFSNKRNEFLSIEQADELLTALKKASQEVWEQALISLHCGLRAGEILGLRWADINIINGMITIMDTKNSIDRKAHMTDKVKEMFKNKKHGRKNELVYSDSVKGKKREISKIFRRVVEELGFNKDIDDRRQRICFHSLRHSFSSWLVQEGEPLYVVQKLLGHSTAALTERYSHLAPENTKKSAKTIENKLKKTTAKVIPIQK